MEASIAFNKWHGSKSLPAFYKSAHPSKGYHKALRLVLDEIPEKHWPFCEAKFLNSRISNLRLDFVPVDLGLPGLQDLHMSLVGLLGFGWGHLIDHGRISRVDIAVDISDVRMDDFHLLPKKSATTKCWRSDGTLQTFQHGKAKHSHTVAYDRKAKREEKGQIWENAGIRIERRIKHPNMWLRELRDLPFPFEGFSIVELPPAKPACEPKNYFWQMFQDSVAARGLTAALALLPTNKRTNYRKHLKAHPAGWWNTEAKWTEWKATLQELRIVYPPEWA